MPTEQDSVQEEMQQPENTVADTSPVTPDTVEQEAGSVDDLPEWAQSVIKDLRQESASRRVATREAETRLKNQEETMTQILEVVKSLADSPDEVPTTEAVQKDGPNVVEKLSKIISKSQRDNNVLRVALELDVPVEVVSNLRGDTYEELSAQTKAITSMIVPPSEDDKAAAKKNKPAKAPSGAQAVGVTDENRRAKYFGVGSVKNVGIFDGGGVVSHSED